MSKKLHKKLLSETRYKIDELWNNYSKNIINGEASVFIGSGASIDSGLPSWGKLLRPCLKQLSIKENDNISLYKVAQYFSNTHSESKLREIVQEQISNIFQANPIHEKLLSIPFKSIWTTNYDDLIESELKKKLVQHNVVFEEKSLSQLNTYDKINVYKINGDKNTPHKMVLTQHDYENYESTHSLFLTFLKKELISNSFLFIGYSFEDQIVLNCLSSTMRLLGGLGSLHYALIHISDKTTEEIRYKVDDLKKRYNVECIYVDSETITEVIDLLNKKIKRNKVFISGAYFEVEKEVDTFADNLSKSLVTHLLENGNRIATGIGRRLGTYITGYAHQYLAEHSFGNPQKYLSMRPFPFHVELTDAQKENYRTLMQHDCNSAIFMFGQSEHTYESGGYPKHRHHSYGVNQEFLIAKKLGLHIIPVGSTGFESEIIWENVKSQINKFPYLSKKIDILKNEKNPEKLSKVIVSILNQIGK